MSVTRPRDSDCAGFYLWPPVWIGTPPPEQGPDLTATLINAEAFSGNFACGVRLKVSKQGLFVFDFAQWEPGSTALTKNPLENWREKVFARMRFFNFFLACLYTPGLRLQKTTSPKLFIDYTTYAAAREFALNRGHLQCDYRQAWVMREAEDLHLKFKPVCMSVEINVVREAVAMCDAVNADSLRDVATLAELILHAFYLHESGKYEASHIAAWTISERCIHEQWKRHLAELDNRQTTSETKKFINSERKQKLTGRDFTASIVSEFLSLSGLLPFEKYQLVSRVRQKRNDWLHKLDTIDREAAAEAIVLAQFLLCQTGVFDVAIPFHVIEAIPLALVSSQGECP